MSLDSMDRVCALVMKHIRKDYRGHKSEITARELTQIIKRICRHYGMKENDVLFALIRRDWFEAIGSNSYEIHYDKMR